MHWQTLKIVPSNEEGWDGELPRDFYNLDKISTEKFNSEFFSFDAFLNKFFPEKKSQQI